MNKHKCKICKKCQNNCVHINDAVTPAHFHVIVTTYGLYNPGPQSNNKNTTNTKIPRKEKLS